MPIVLIAGLAVSHAPAIATRTVPTPQNVLAGPSWPIYNKPSCYEKAVSGNQAMAFEQTTRMLTSSGTIVRPVTGSRAGGTVNVIIEVIVVIIPGGG
jgi:hypothetical protein